MLARLKGDRRIEAENTARCRDRACLVEHHQGLGVEMKPPGKIEQGA